MTVEDGGRYSRAFERLVTDEADIVGLVAYALYKQRKRDYILAFTEERSERPTVAETAEFERGMLIEKSIGDLRGKAETVLLAYADDVTDQRAPQIRESALTGVVVAARDEMRVAQGFWRQVLQAFIVSVVTTAVLVLLALSAGLFGIDLVDGVGAVRDTLDND